MDWINLTQIVIGPCEYGNEPSYSTKKWILGGSR
jgi:hypothetical protein